MFLPNVLKKKQQILTQDAVNLEMEFVNHVLLAFTSMIIEDVLRFPQNVLTSTSHRDIVNSVTQDIDWVPIISVLLLHHRIETQGVNNSILMAIVRNAHLDFISMILVVAKASPHNVQISISPTESASNATQGTN